MEELKQTPNIIKVNKEGSASAVAKARDVLSSGGTVAFPTESFYGLGVDTGNEKAIKLLFDLKARSSEQPLLLLIASVGELTDYVEEIPDIARVLIRRFWPGGLTMVFKAGRGLSPLLTASTGKIGIRLSGHPLPAALSKALGRPVTGTSANISGQPACSEASEVFEALGNRVDLIMDGGKTEGGPGSTVLDVTVEPLNILREGIITREIIEETLSKRLSVLKN